MQVQIDWAWAAVALGAVGRVGMVSEHDLAGIANEDEGHVVGTQAGQDLVAPLAEPTADLHDSDQIQPIDPRLESVKQADTNGAQDGAVSCRVIVTDAHSATETVPAMEAYEVLLVLRDPHSAAGLKQVSTVQDLAAS